MKYQCKMMNNLEKDVQDYNIFQLATSNDLFDLIRELERRKKYRFSKEFSNYSKYEIEEAIKIYSSKDCIKTRADIVPYTIVSKLVYGIKDFKNHKIYKDMDIIVEKYTQRYLNGEDITFDLVRKELFEKEY